MTHDSLHLSSELAFFVVGIGYCDEKLLLLPRLPQLPHSATEPRTCEAMKANILHLIKARQQNTESA